jgi:hypothetical protein
MSHDVVVGGDGERACVCMYDVHPQRMVMVVRAAMLMMVTS